VTGHKVLLFEPVHQKGLDHLTENGATIVYAQGFDAESIKRAVPDVDAILARAQGWIDGDIMDAAPKLKVVGRHGIGVDNIDVDAATDRGIHIVNTPVAPAESVAEFVVMSMIALPRQIVRADAATRSNNWGFRNEVHAPELMGKTLGVVGFGRIGRRIAEICSLGLRMNIVYSDAYPAPEEEEKRLGARRVELNDLLSTADFVTLNVPLLDSTHHLIDEAALKKMKKDAYLVNCSRGPVVDEAALVDALRTETIAGAVIDVFETEPVTKGNPLFELENVLLTPHCSGHSRESAQNMAMVASDIIKVLQGQKPDYPVNDPRNARQVTS
jgi:D-3-phosphoglycerate dehydrogenase